MLCQDPVLVFKLAYYPDQYLKNKAVVPVTDFTEISDISKTMFDTLSMTGGKGLSANQCKLDYRMFVIRTLHLRKTFVNPIMEIVPQSIELEREETCVSFPSCKIKHSRFQNIWIKAQDVFGEVFVTELYGAEAIIAQHEMDHLDGKTFADKYNFFQRCSIARKVKKALP